ncbi:MAG: Peptide methionine sulfoxide reductase MsrA [Firmicutes bacterium]|nr:Peptide methionine sulfoxide reductase MsrA [Bacillota bacterium]
MSEMAIFAGGCFWCMVSPFYALEGVISIDSGYIGGHLKNPTYEDVKKQKSGHYEAVRIIYDPGLTSYDELLAAFWVQIDPTDPGGQFHDRGPSYRTAIFYQNDHQRREALASKAELENSRRFAAPIVTEILPASQFYVAEEYHQDFHQKNPVAYQADRAVSGRDEFIKKHWGEDYWDLLVKKK